jgi:TonB family protein
VDLARYRLAVAAQNRRRLWGCLAVAGLLHGLAWGLRPGESPPTVEPIQFVAIGQPTPRRVAPQGGQVNLGKPDRQKETLQAQVSAVTNDPLWGEYLMALRQRIDERRTDERWTDERQTDQGQPRRPPKVRFIIDRQGHLLETELLQSSGDAAIDLAALKAVQSSAPFGKFPDRATEDRLRVTFNFD